MRIRSPLYARGLTSTKTNTKANTAQIKSQAYMPQAYKPQAYSEPLTKPQAYYARGLDFKDLQS